MSKLLERAKVTGLAMGLLVSACAGDLADEFLTGEQPGADGGPGGSAAAGSGGTSGGAGSGGAGSGGAGAAGMAGGDAPTCTLDVIDEIFSPKCGACHSASVTSGGLDLVSADLPSRVFDVAATADCGGRTLANQEDPDASVLLIRLAPSECGSSMPLGGTPLTDEEIACVRAWIAGGGQP